MGYLRLLESSEEQLSNPNCLSLVRGLGRNGLRRGCARDAVRVCALDDHVVLPVRGESVRAHEREQVGARGREVGRFRRDSSAVVYELHLHGVARR